MVVGMRCKLSAGHIMFCCLGSWTGNIRAEVKLGAGVQLGCLRLNLVIHSLSLAEAPPNSQDSGLHLAFQPPFFTSSSTSHDQY